MNPIQPPNCEECNKTNTCGGCPLVLATINLADKITEINGDPDIQRMLAKIIESRLN